MQARINGKQTVGKKCTITATLLSYILDKCGWGSSQFNPVQSRSQQMGQERWFCLFICFLACCGRVFFTQLRLYQANMALQTEQKTYFSECHLKGTSNKCALQITLDGTLVLMKYCKHVLQHCDNLSVPKHRCELRHKYQPRMYKTRFGILYHYPT